MQFIVISNIKLTWKLVKQELEDNLGLKIQTSMWNTKMYMKFTSFSDINVGKYVSMQLDKST